MRIKNEEDKVFWQNALTIVAVAWTFAGLFVWALIR